MGRAIRKDGEAHPVGLPEDVDEVDGEGYPLLLHGLRPDVLDDVDQSRLGVQKQPRWPLLDLEAHGDVCQRPARREDASVHADQLPALSVQALQGGQGDRLGRLADARPHELAKLHRREVRCGPDFLDGLEVMHVGNLAAPPYNVGVRHESAERRLRAGLAVALRQPSLLCVHAGREADVPIFHAVAGVRASSRRLARGETLRVLRLVFRPPLLYHLLTSGLEHIFPSVTHVGTEDVVEDHHVLRVVPSFLLRWFPCASGFPCGRGEGLTLDPVAAACAELVSGLLFPRLLLVYPAALRNRSQLVQVVHQKLVGFPRSPKAFSAVLGLRVVRASIRSRPMHHVPILVQPTLRMHEGLPWWQVLLQGLHLVQPVARRGFLWGVRAQWHPPVRVLFPFAVHKHGACDSHVQNLLFHVHRRP
mmetsp:Transcript_78692/g.218578  ORF Transcript_78692/g.218578 Transcript_78692/m.218578 type:complete len:419 (-) Transcript_78692:422-1678(-)